MFPVYQDIRRNEISQFQKNARSKPFNSPLELQVEVLSYLNLAEVEVSFQVCKAWRKLSEDTLLIKNIIFNEVIFGPDKWAKYFEGFAKEEESKAELSALPKDIWKILTDPCPIFPGKKVWQTHVLAWIPKTLKGQPLTINSLGVLAKKYFPNSRSAYRVNSISRDIGDAPIDKSHWVLMTSHILPGSKKLSYVNQPKMVAELAKRAAIPYELPSALEAIICIFMKLICSGTRLFSYLGPNATTYIRCHDQVFDYPTGVGGFYRDGLDVVVLTHPSGDTGIAVLRKF